MKRHILLGIVFIVPLLTFFSVSCDKDSTTEPKTETIILTKITGDNQQGVQGDTLSTALAVLVTDKDGKAVSGKQIDFKIKEGKGTLSAENINTDENGQASAILILGDQQGKVTVEVIIAGTNISTTFTAIIGIHKPYSIEIASGDDQWACPGETLPKSLQAVVKDKWGRPFEGAVVTFSIDEGTGSLSALSDTTSISGTAKTILTFGDSIGTTTVTASLQGIDSPASVKFTLTAVPPKIEIFSGNNQIGYSSEKLPQSLQVQVKNNNGISFQGIMVSFNVVEGNGILSLSENTTDENGIAETNLTAGDNPGIIRVTAIAPNGVSSVEFSMRIVSPSKIAFVKNRNIHLMNPDGSNQVELTTGKSPSWSSDGTRIAFEYINIYVMNIDSSNMIMLTDKGFSPTWSPYGDKIAFISWEDASICTINTVGSNLIKLVSFDTRGGLYSLSWSPDGNWIAFTKGVWLSSQINLHIINLVTMLSSCIVNNYPSYRADSPSWSPDGTLIAYSFYKSGWSPEKSDIYIINIDSWNKVNITYNSASDDNDPSWSPDGTLIAFVSDRDGEDAIYIMNSDGSNVQRIADGSSPAWSPILSR